MDSSNSQCRAGDLSPPVIESEFTITQKDWELTGLSSLSPAMESLALDLIDARRLFYNDFTNIILFFLLLLKTINLNQKIN